MGERQVQGVEGVTAKRGQPSGEPAWQHRVKQESHAAGGWMRFARARRVANAKGGQDVVTLEILVVAQEVIGRRAPAQQFEDLFHRIPESTDTRLPMTDVRVNRDAIKERRHSPSLTTFPDWSGS